MTKEQYIDELRDQIINTLNTTHPILLRWHCFEYTLGVVPEHISNEIFEGKSKLFLDLEKHKVYAHIKIEEYLNDRSSSIRELSPIEFHTIAVKSGFPNTLQALQTQEDWTLLFNEKLLNTVEKVLGILEEQNNNNQEEWCRREREEAVRFAPTEERMRIQQGICIPLSYTRKFPALNLTQFESKLWQRYGATIIEYKGNRTWSLFSHSYAMRTFTETEQIWIEDRIAEVLSDKSNETWRSLPGGDTMDLIIGTAQGTLVDFTDMFPFRKYVELSLDLQKLISYGSKTEEEHIAGIHERDIIIPDSYKERELFFPLTKFRFVENCHSTITVQQKENVWLAEYELYYGPDALSNKKFTRELSHAQLVWITEQIMYAMEYPKRRIYCKGPIDMEIEISRIDSGKFFYPICHEGYSKLYEYLSQMITYGSIFTSELEADPYCRPH